MEAKTKAAVTFKIRMLHTCFFLVDRPPVSWLKRLCISYLHVAPFYFLNIREHSADVFPARFVQGFWRLNIFLFLLQTWLHVKQKISTPTLYAAVRPVAQGIRRRQQSRPNNGVGIVCSRSLIRRRCRPLSEHARFSRFYVL